jgi:archaellum component FlaC
MRAYVLRNNELELMWSWDSDGEPPDEAAAASEPETGGDSTSNDSSIPAGALSSESHENNGGGMHSELGALDGAVRITPEPEAAAPVEPPVRTPIPVSPAETLEEWVQAAIAAIGGAIRQQEEEIQELRDDASRAEGESKLWPAQMQALHARLDVLDGRVEAILSKIDSAVSDQAHSATKPEELPERVENTAEPESAKLSKLESRVEEISRRLDVVVASEQVSKVPKEVEATVEKLEEPAAAAQPVAAPEPVVAAEPAVVPEPIVVAEPVAVPEPIVVAEAAAVPEPAATIEPVVVPEPATAAEPVVAAAEPVVAVKPVVIAEPVVTAEPVAEARPAAATGPAAAAEPFREPVRRRRFLWKRLIFVALAAGMPLAGWWSYTHRGKIDAFRDPGPPSAIKARIPEPALTEAPKASEAAPKVSIVVTAKEQIWLEAEADNNKVFAKVLLLNQTKSFDASQQIKIVTGNVAGTSVSYNGNEIGPLGYGHHIGAFLFTPQDWKRVPR